VEAEKRIWKCGICKEALVMKKKVFSYLGHNVSHEALACPKCGQIFISEELAEGKMAEVEQQLEDK
jgi:hypothetical protein